MELKQRITAFEAEITALGGAIEAIKAEQVRPSDPICDEAFSLLKQSLAAIDHDGIPESYANAN